MHSTNDEHTPVNAKVVLIDAQSMTALWMNEAASQDYAEDGIDFAPGIPVAEAVPMAELLGLPKALEAVASTGVAQHLRTNLVSTAQGSLAIASSVYRLPDGKLLLVMEHAWQKDWATKGRVPRRPGHKAR